MKLSYFSSALAAIACAGSMVTAALTPFSVTYDVLNLEVRMSLAATVDVAFDTDDAWLTKRTASYLIAVDELIERGEMTYPKFGDMMDKYFQAALDYDGDKFTDLVDLVTKRQNELSQRTSLYFAPQSTVDVIFAVLGHIVNPASAEIAELVEKEHKFAEASVTQGKSLALVAMRMQTMLDTVERLDSDIYGSFVTALMAVMDDAHAEFGLVTESS